MKLQRRQTKKPVGGYAKFLHILLVITLPLLAYVLVRLDFSWIAILLVLLSKWRMFAVKSRHWPANIRANAVDILVGLSFVMFMIIADTQAFQLTYAVLYIIWLLFIKPKSSALWVGIQAMIAQTLALAAVFLYWQEVSTIYLVLAVWVVTYACSRHFLTAYDEAMARSTAYTWAFFASSIAWLSGHWLIFYGPIAQPVLMLSVLGYGLASMYYLQHTDRLTANVKRQFIAVMAVLVLFLIVFSDWSDKTV